MGHNILFSHVNLNLELYAAVFKDQITGKNKGGFWWLHDFYSAHMTMSPW